MSFYSHRSNTDDLCPGSIVGDAAKGLCERVCIQVKKVYDSCMQQEQFDNLRLCPDSFSGGCNPQEPFTYVSARSAGGAGKLRDLCIDRLEERPNFARVRCVVDIPMEIVFLDATCREFTGRAVISVPKDVILYVPPESVIPFTADTIAGAVSVLGTYVGGGAFCITACVTIILKIVAEVELMIPSYGFCRIPPCEEFACEVCDEFFNLPLFPPTNSTC